MSENFAARNTLKGRQSGDEDTHTPDPPRSDSGGWGGVRPRTVQPRVTVVPRNPNHDIFKPYVYRGRDSRSN